MGSPVNVIGNRVKNLLINGALDYWQRTNINTALTSSGGNYKTSDRWLVGFFGTITSPSSGRTFLTPNSFGPFTAKWVDSLTGNPTGSATLLRRQRIESEIIAPIARAGGKVSLSFLARTGTFLLTPGIGFESITVRFHYPIGLDNWSNSTQFFETTLPVNVFNELRLLKVENVAVHPNCVNGMMVSIEAATATGNGTTYNFFSTEFMLNEGSAAAPFRRYGEDHAAELLACQRYLTKTYAQDIPLGTFPHNTNAWTGAPDAAVNNFHFGFYTFPVELRTVPVMRFFSPQTGVEGLSNAVWNGTTNVPISPYSIGSRGLGAHINGSSTSVGQTVYTHFAMDAEL